MTIANEIDQVDINRLSQIQTELMEKLEEASYVFQYLGMTYYNEISDAWLTEAKYLINGQGPKFEKDSLDKTIRELRKALLEQEDEDGC